MFTTIAKLRSSPASQERVTQVETALKKRFGGQWDTSNVFPILFIVISNGVADYRWVMEHRGTHVQVPGWTAAVTASLNAARPKSWAANLSESSAITYLELIGQQVKLHNAKVPFYPKDRNDAGLIPTKAPQAKGKKVLATKDVESQDTSTPVEVQPAWPFPKSHDPVTRKGLEKLGHLAVDAAVEAAESLRPTPKKPLPLPSVLKQIRDLCKSHAKITLTENKSPVSGESKITIHW